MSFLLFFTKIKIIKANIGRAISREILVNIEVKNRSMVRKYFFLDKKNRDRKKNRLFRESVWPQNELLYITAGLKINEELAIIANVFEDFSLTIK